MIIRKFLIITAILTSAMLMQAQNGDHELKLGVEMKMFTDFGSYTSIHTGLFAEYSYGLYAWDFADAGTVTLKAGAKTGLQFEAGSNFPRGLHFQALPVYVPLQPLAAVTYRNGGFECSLKTAVGGELVIYEGVSPYVQWLITPGADFTWMFSENWGVSAQINWDFGGTIDIWNGPSLGVCGTSQF